MTLIFVTASPAPVAIDAEWKARYASWGIEVLEVCCAPPSIPQWNEPWPARLSAQLALHLQRFDVVYFQDWANPGFRAIRERRFSGRRGPVLVTVLHGPSCWVRSGNRKPPTIPADLQLDFLERYSAENSDWTISPSRYMMEWLKQRGWTFPREPQILRLPYLSDREAPVAAASSIERLVFFGRLEVRKGFEIFADALRLLCAEHPDAIAGLKEIVLLGQEREPGSVVRLRRALAVTGIAVVHLSNLASVAARSYLAARAAATLVVIPSPFENFPYAVIETLSIPGLNVICSRGGGIPEIFGPGHDSQLFDPLPEALAEALRHRLAAPLAPNQLASYDSAAANAHWLEFHRRVCAECPPAARRPAGRPSVDVCVPYFNKGRYLPQCLDALTVQTEAGIGLILIDDGSTEPESRAAFDAAAQEYVGRGWRFVRQENSFVDAARNRAAQLSRADYLLFLDPDDVPVPHAIERLLDAAQTSGLDCVLCGGWLFDSDPAQPLAGYLPLGPDLATGMVDPMVFGLPMILIRREVFEQIGGYRPQRGAGHEDWELQIRLRLAGFKADVLPEYLIHFRRAADGLSQTAGEFPSTRRLVEAYAAPLREARMTGLAEVLLHLSRQCRDFEQRLVRNVPLALRMQFEESRRPRS